MLSGMWKRNGFRSNGRVMKSVLFAPTQIAIQTATISSKEPYSIKENAFRLSVEIGKGYVWIRYTVKQPWQNP